MSILARLRSTYLRIDARSLGLFRIAMACALIGDWWVRWVDSRAFYSNEGVLTNHAHLYNVLRRDPPERVWSVFHAFSTPGEAAVALLLTLLVYVLFLIGVKTRIFHVLSLALLVSLTGRNILAEGPANHLGILVLAATAFLPCGSRFSIDSLRDSFKRRKEKDANALNDRTPETERAVAAERPAGWSPTSLAALAVLLQLTIVFVAIARQQGGARWHDGTALHYGLWVERYVSDIGMLVRRAPPGLLRAWSQLLRFTPWAAPVLLFVPLPRFTRPVAFGLVLFYGLSYGLLFDFGLWGWTFAAASFLVIASESWDAWQSRWAKGRALTVIYDADCGICLWLVRLLRRLDLRGHLTFQGNDALTTPPGAPGANPPYRTAAGEGAEEAARILYRRATPSGAVEAAPLPAAVTDELVTGTVVAVDDKGHVATEGEAIAAIVRSLPLGALLSLPLRIPGTRGLWNALYRLVPPRRYAISEALGMGACGVPRAANALSEQASPAAPDVPPSLRMRRVITGAVREVGAVTLLLAAAAQTAKANPWPASLVIPQNALFSAVTAWGRMGARYDVLAPEPPSEDGVLVVDAQTRGGQSIDPLTGAAPSLETPRFRLGVLWSEYTEHIRKKEHADVEKGFRDFLSLKNGRFGPSETADTQIVGLDVYWLVYRSPAPGGSAVEVTGREKVFSHSRGGKGDTRLPILRAPLIR